MPLDEHIKGGHGEREPCLKRRPAPMHHLLEVTDERQHREHCLYQHAVLPLTALTEFEIARIAFRGMEAGVTQDNHLFFESSNEPLKGVSRHMGRGTRPPHDQAPLVEQQTEFAPDNPAVVRPAFPAARLWAPTLSDGVDELDAI